VYIAGTEPVQMCPIHGGRIITTTVSGWDTNPNAAPPAPSRTYSQPPAAPNVAPDAIAQRAARQIVPDPPPAQQSPPAPAGQPKKPAKKGLLHRILGVIK
jgi:hypothetical protein